MGTRSLTIFQSDNEEIVVMYRQFDGYPSGHGAELAEFLADGVMVNGLTGGDKKVFNGMGCLAAQVVAHFKEDAGGFYLYPADTRDCWEEYLYVVTGNTGEVPHIQVYAVHGFEETRREELLYSASADLVLNWCKEND